MLLAGVSLALAPSAAWAQEQAPATQARLFTDVVEAQPGEPFWIGLELTMAPGWHTYWKNPGDAGMATKVQWQPFEGATVGPIQWPVPKRFEETGNGITLVSYGYEGEVVLPIRVTPSRDLPPSGELTLTGRAEWVECREVCVRRTQPLTLTVPLGPQMHVGFDGMMELVTAHQAVPTPHTGWDVTATVRGNTLTLTTQAPPGAEQVPSKLQVYPEEPGTLDLAAPQSVTVTPQGHRIELMLSPYAKGPPAWFRALLVAEDGMFGTRTVGPTRVIAINVPVKS
jgi:thiol:disulfide interchange protein DsbD